MSLYIEENVTVGVEFQASPQTIKTNNKKKKKEKELESDTSINYLSQCVYLNKRIWMPKESTVVA